MPQNVRLGHRMRLKKNIPWQKIQQFLVNYFACSLLDSFDCRKVTCKMYFVSVFATFAQVNKISRFFRSTQIILSGMGPADMGRRHLPIPGNVVKCFCAANVVYSLSRRSIYALFWENVVSFSGLDPQTPIRALPLNSAGDFRPSDPSLPTPGKKSCGRPCFRAE